MFSKHKILLSLILCSCLFVSGFAHATWAGRFLIGAEGGLAYRDADLNYDILHPVPNRSTHLIRPNNDTGFMAGILGGYELTCNDYFGSLELHAHWEDFGDAHTFFYNDVLTNGYAGSATYERGAVFGLSTRLGYHLTPWMGAYIRLGAETSRDKIIFQSTRVVPAGPVINLHHSEQVFRFLGGFGFQWPVLKQATVRLEYNYASRVKVSTSGFASDNLIFYSAHVRPLQHGIKAAFVWYFG